MWPSPSSSRNRSRWRRRSSSVTRGPSVTRYEFTLSQGVKLSKITNLQDDIALALGASGVRIAPIPDKISVVGVEVPNKLVSPVSIRTVLESTEFTTHPSTTAFAVGKDISGKNIVGNISKLPHVLIAGTTGSGKSVCTNSLIVSMLYKSTPEEVRFIMVDPKMVELAPYNGIPHLLIPVVTDPKKAAGALQWAVYEMMKRYKMFSEHNVKDLASYNKVAETDETLKKLPSVVVVIDELADLMLVAAKEVEESICRVAQMGRAAGMHLVIATQRPSADVITGLMKANIPSRIAFAVSSALESRIILDNPGAEKLIGMGDMLSLIEKAQQSYDQKKAAELEEKIRRSRFTLNDYLEQFGQIKNMGSMEQILGMLPGAGAKMKDIKVDEKAIGRTEAIIRSMTPKEREKPEIINPSRKRRIAAGSGTSVEEVNRLLKQFDQTNKLMKQLTGGGNSRMMKRLLGKKGKMPF